MQEPPTIFTIGHSNHDPASFLGLLRQHGVATLVDVRTAPYSRYAPHFNRGSLTYLLDEAGIEYVWAGEELGGRPQDPACYRDGVVRSLEVDYRAMARRPSYRCGIDRLLQTAGEGRAVVMCSEEDPRRCHRHRLIEVSLRERGVIVLHIRRDGAVETIEPGESAAAETAAPQLPLPGLAE